MPNRAQDWFAQAERDLAQADDSCQAARYEWACFAAQQAAEKAAKALHLAHAQEARGHVVAKLLKELPPSARAPDELVEGAHVLDDSVPSLLTTPTQAVKYFVLQRKLASCSGTT